MKFTREVTRNGKTAWIFSPPRDVRNAGICEPKTFTDGRTARHEIPKLVDLVKRYRKGELKEGALHEDSCIVHLRNYYLNSDYFRQLAPSSQKAYEGILNQVCGVKVRGKPFGLFKIRDLTTALCRDLYRTMVDEGTIYSANSKARVLSIVLNFGVNLELYHFNPMSRVKKLKHEADTKIWTQEQVEKFLDTAYSTFEYRNIGLLTHMCYEWAQRPVDISLLTWDQFDWDNNSITITQTKRGATVHLPLEEPLLSLLLKQKEDWDFQPYVVPHVVPSGTVYKVMTQNNIKSMFNKARKEAGLESDLKLGNLRKTGIMEMVEAGVDSTGIMQVSGHKNLTSLNPYMKHTLKGATSALAKRRNK